MEETRSRLDRGGAATRTKILDAATRMVAEKGVAGLRIRAVAHEAGIREGSLYNHFAGRADIIRAIFRRADASMSPFGVVLDVETSPSEHVDAARDFIRSQGLDAFLEGATGQIIARFRSDPLLFRFLRAVSGARSHDEDARAAYDGFFLGEMRRVFRSAVSLAAESGRLKPGAPAEGVADLLVAAFEHALGSTRGDGDLAAFGAELGRLVQSVAALCRP